MENFSTREKRREFFLKPFSENCETEEKSKTCERTTLEYTHTHKKNEDTHRHTQTHTDTHRHAHARAHTHTHEKKKSKQTF